MWTGAPGVGTGPVGAEPDGAPPVGASPAGTLGAEDRVVETPVEAGTETDGLAEGPPEGIGCWVDVWDGQTVTVSLMVTVGTGVAVAPGGGVKVLEVGSQGTMVVRVSVMVGMGLTAEAGVVVGKAV